MRVVSLKIGGLATEKKAPRQTRGNSSNSFTIKEIKMIKVVAQGKSEDVEYKERMTVREAAEVAGVAYDRKTMYLVNSEDAGLNTSVTDGSTVVLSKKVSNG